MLCSKCGVELRNENGHYSFTGDDSPDIETKLWMNLDLVCRNKSCADYGKVQSTRQVEVKTI